jgi:NADPH:quinone reductase-like Zn-dependent oxidoreductase
MENTLVVLHYLGASPRDINKSSSNMSNRAAFVESEKGQIIVCDTEIAELEEGEILVKVLACALQPGDAMVAKLAIVPVDYPAILGVPIAGVIEAVGPGVTKVSVGDRIFCATKILSHKKAKYGGLQRFSTVDAAQAVLVSSSEYLNTTVRSHFCYR